MFKIDAGIAAGPMGCAAARRRHGVGRVRGATKTYFTSPSNSTFATTSHQAWQPKESSP